MMKSSKSIEIFNSVDLESINLFLLIVQSLHVPRAELVDRRYSEIRSNGRTVLSFLLSLGIILIKKQGSTLEYKSTLLSREKVTPGALVSHFEKRVHYFPEVIDYLSLFTVDSKGKAIFSGSAYQNVKYANIRNFLISCQIVNYFADTDKYELGDHYSKLLKLKIVKKHSISKDALRIQLANKKIIGDLAEKAVFEYECNRLKSEPLVMSQVELISEKDEIAGYDIRSFIINDEGIFIPIRIEVKAVPKISLRFIWTENELNQSIQDSDNYYLYLLPVIDNRKFDIRNMKIIQNPYKKVFKSKINWTKRPQAYIIEQIHKD